MSELPREWLLKEIGEIGEIVSGGTPSTKNPDYWGEDVPWVTPIDLSGYNEKYIRMGRKGLTKLGLKKFFHTIDAQRVSFVFVASAYWICCNSPERLGDKSGF